MTRAVQKPDINDLYDDVYEKLGRLDRTMAGVWDLLNTPQPPDMTVVTALPGAPTDGMEVAFLVDPAEGGLWHLRYRALNPDGSSNASPYKWDVVGGATPLVASGIASSMPITPLAYTDLGVPGVTPPLAGDYVVELGCQAWFAADRGSGVGGAPAPTPGWEVSAFMSYQIGGTAATDADAVQISAGYYAVEDADRIGHGRSKLKTGLPAAQLAPRFRAVTLQNANFHFVSFAGCWIKATPLRVG